MTKRKNSVKSPAASAVPTKKGTRLGRDLIASLKEIAQWKRGEIALETRMVPTSIDVAAIRAKQKLSQGAFATRYGFSLRTLQEWEQRRTHPDGAARAYLTVIDRNPKAVSDALGDGAR
jgi:putative transcriptional regulator